MTVVVDYEAGNLRSVETALTRLNSDFITTSRPEDIKKAQKLIVPGVGEARAAMDVLKRSGLGEAIIEFFSSGKPLLGICLGIQVIFEHSEESDTSCLGMLPGTVKRFQRDAGLKIPHMGWNRIFSKFEHPILSGVTDGTFFYFVHSYYPVPADKDMIVAECDYGCRFAAGVARDNLIAFQFHPEKSGLVGLKLLSNFLKWNP